MKVSYFKLCSFIVVKFCFILYRGRKISLFVVKHVEDLYLYIFFSYNVMDSLNVKENGQ